MQKDLDEISKSSCSEEDDVISDDLVKDNKILERINENDEDNYSTNRETETKDFDSFQQEPSEVIISNLKQKIKILEDQMANLRKKNDELTKNNFHNDRKIKRMSFVGNRKNFLIGIKDNNDQIKMAELLKEKSDLQEINENMLNMLTEKELENEELQEKYMNYQNEVKIEIQKYLDTIIELEDKIAQNEQNKENYDNDLDEVVQEYNKYKERMEKTLNEHIKKEDELNVKLSRKESVILDIKVDMENLEIENKQLKSLTEQKEDQYNNELYDINSYMKENEKLKNENLYLEEKVKKFEKKNELNMSLKEDEIKMIKEDLEYKTKSLNKLKEEKNKEINLLKAEINKYNRDINSILKKDELIQKENEEIKNNMLTLQNKLDKKTKELQEINDSAKKILENKENIIKEYEKEIEEINKDKKQLIEQNHDLLDKLKSYNSSNLGEILDGEEEDTKDNKEDYETMLLKAEIKTLKQQLENQANDLISLNAMEKEISRLKLENEKLEKDNKAFKNKKKFGSTGKIPSLVNYPKGSNNTQTNKTKKRVSFSIERKLFLNNKFTFEHSKSQKIGSYGILKKKEEKNIIISNTPNNESNEINKLKEDIALLKVQFFNRDFENETLIAKYKGVIKSIKQECKKMGMNLNLDLNNM